MRCRIGLLEDRRSRNLLATAQGVALVNTRVVPHPLDVYSSAAADVSLTNTPLRLSLLRDRYQPHGPHAQIDQLHRCPGIGVVEDSLMRLMEGVRQVPAHTTPQPDVPD